MFSAITDSFTLILQVAGMPHGMPATILLQLTQWKIAVSATETVTVRGKQ